MKKLILLAMVLGTIACHRHSYITGPQGKAGKDGINGVDGATGATGSSGATGATGATGAAGSNGVNGTNGLNGHSMASRSSIADSSLCVNGGNVLSVGLDINDDTVLQDGEISDVLVACNGLNGANGSNGTNGTNGSNGSNGSNGATGATGAAGSNAPPTAFTPVALINPCGASPSGFDEMFIKLQNGMVIASFSDNNTGYNTRMSVLRAGTYQTTDNDACIFTLDSSGNITYENHHYN